MKDHPVFVMAQGVFGVFASAAAYITADQVAKYVGIGVGLLTAFSIILTIRKQIRDRNK